MSSSRRLLAIVFTDIVGYSALMDHDESSTLELLAQNRAIHKKYISRHGGKLIKEIGDGVFASFRTSLSALFCASEILSAVENIQDLNLRIGVHLGEVTQSNGDIFGSGVNIASRIEGLAQPGEILISESVYLNIANRKEFSTEFLGKKKLKNVSDVIGIYRLEMVPDAKIERPLLMSSRNRNIWIATIAFLSIFVLLFMYTDFGADKGARNPVEASIVILPFDAVNPSEQYDWLPGALSDEVRRNIATVPGFKVIPGATVRRYEDQNVDLEDLNRKLNVSFAADGSILFKGNTASISFELFDTRNNDIELSDGFDFSMDSIYEAQKRIAEKITLMIRPALPSDLHSWPDVNGQAFQHYLKGWHHNNILELELAEREFNRALQYEEDFAWAYAGLADVYLKWAHLGRRPHTVFPKAITYAEHALEIDPENAYALTAIADCYYHYHYDWQFSETHFQKALQINPNYENTMWWYSGMLSAMNRHAEAIELIERVSSLDPYNMPALVWSMRTYYWARQNNNARAAYQRLLEVWPDIPVPYLWLDYPKVFPEQSDRSIEILQEKVVSIGTFYPKIGLAIAYIQNGQHAEATTVLDNLLPDADKIGPNYVAQIFVLLGQLDEAIMYLEEALKQRDPALIWINADPVFDPLREDPRFQVIIDSMQLSQHPPF